MRHFRILGLITIVLATWCGPAAHAELRGGGGAHIEWEVKNRFRLFRSEADFQRHVAATRNDGVLAAERLLARETDGRGWARDTVERLCVDRAGKLLEVCDRIGVMSRGYLREIRPGRCARGLSVAARSPRRCGACRNGAGE